MKRIKWQNIGKCDLFASKNFSSTPSAVQQTTKYKKSTIKHLYEVPSKTKSFCLYLQTDLFSLDCRWSTQKKISVGIITSVVGIVIIVAIILAVLLTRKGEYCTSSSSHLFGAKGVFQIQFRTYQISSSELWRVFL